MRIELSGFRRKVVEHTHEVESRRIPDSPRGQNSEALQWASGTEARGLIREVGLSGDFRVKVHFEKQDFENWAQVFAKTSPVSALRFASQLHTQALVEMQQQRD